MSEYQKFLKTKTNKITESGIEISDNKLNSNLFDFQKWIVKTSLKKGRYAVFADCGLGKTIMQLDWAYQVWKHNHQPVLILCPLAVSGQTIQEGKKFGIEVFRLSQTENPITTDFGGIWISNYEQIENIDCSIFGGVVLDECFPPETQIEVFNIDNTLTMKYIKNIKVGDNIKNAQGGDYVKAIYKRRIDRAVCIKAGNRSITCSENHPFFTLHGWKCAQDLQADDYIMETKTAVRLVRDNIYPRICSNEKAKILQSILFSEMENEDTRDKNQSSQSYSCGEKRIKKIGMVQRREPYSYKGIKEDNSIKPDEQSRDTEEGITYIAEDEAQTFRAWGKWSSADIASANNEGCTIRKLDNGICYIVGKTTARFSKLLQSRLRQSRLENSNRDRWSKSSRLLKKRFRQKKGFKAGFVRVESVEILEQGHPELEKYRDAEGNIYFYDIKAERHPSFSVEGLLVHNSSILKNYEGIIKRKLINNFINTTYKLCCTATPSPNDPMEIGNHSEFLNVMSRSEMLSMYFVHDGGETSKWRLKKHCESIFWEWVSTWACMLTKPHDIGFNNKGYDLPLLNLIEKKIITKKRENEYLFNEIAISATSFNSELRITRIDRLQCVIDIVNNSNDNYIIWVKHNEEGDYLKKRIPDAIEVRGNDTQEFKEKNLLGFANNEFRVLITKSKIAQFGLNYQNCHNQIFASLDFSFESLYQSIRRSYRFGQTNSVNIWLLTTDTMQNVIESIHKKQKQFQNMQIAMTMATNLNRERNNKKMNKEFKEIKTDDYLIQMGDCVELIKNIDNNTIGLSVFSPPFASLYTYSDELEDMGNSKDYNEFFYAFTFLVKELYRVMIQGRNVVVHCMDLPIQKGKEGYIGLRDFSNMIRQSFEDNGFIYHSRVTIWKDPVIEMQRTKALGLLHKQIKKDASMSRVGLPDYLLVFRKKGDNPNPIKCDLSVDVWQKYASPVWMDIDYSNTLNKQGARDYKDEKHICPLQLETIKRVIYLWSNKGDLILTPFMGIGSEIYQAVKMDRRGIGFELKKSYFDVAVKNCEMASLEKKQINLL